MDRKAANVDEAERRVKNSNQSHVVEGETLQAAGIRWAEACKDMEPRLTPASYIAALRRMYPNAKLVLGEMYWRK